MSNYNSLKATINANVKQNGNQEITGNILNSVLNAMVNTLGLGYQFMGVATPSLSPGTPDGKVFYFASSAGTYSNFGGLVVSEGEVAVLKYDTSWSKEVTGAATSKQVDQLFGGTRVLLNDVTTSPGIVYITADMVSPGDVLTFEMTSLNNLVGVLRAEKTGYVFDANIYVDAGQTATMQYVVPEDFLRIYTQGNANPMRVTCTKRTYGLIDQLTERIDALEEEFSSLSGSAIKVADILQVIGTNTDKPMSQNAITKYGDSPFLTIVPDSLNGFVSFRMNNVSGNNMPVDDYMQFRISSIYMGRAWNLFVQMQKSVDGTTWTNLDTIERLASAAPNPLPVVEEITSKYGAFTAIVNWKMMGTASLSGVSYILKKAAPNYFARKLQEQIDSINLWPFWGDYELKDRTKQIIKVDINGGGDFTSIADAYASITDSSYNNQYEVVIYPGTYHEYNLIPPKFTHTHGLIPGSVVVTSEGVTSTLPVFDQRVPCKLSNMTIISGTGYCVHQDQSTLNFTMLINENLHCKKVYGQDVSNFKFRTITNPAVLGIGSHLFGAKFIWNNCTFENGQVAAHTVGGSDSTPANQHLIYRNCKLVNAYVHLLVVGTSEKVGTFVCEVDGLFTEKGRPSVVCQLGARSSGDTTYNFPWQIIGGGNKNLVVVTLNNSDTSVNDVWANVNTDDITLVQLASGVSVTKGQFVDIAGNVCNESTPSEDVIGMALEDAAAGETVKVCTGSFPFNNNFNSFSFPYTPNDGVYGIGADGKLLRDAAIRIGVVKYNNFYWDR